MRFYDWYLTKGLPAFVATFMVSWARGSTREPGDLATDWWGLVFAVTTFALVYLVTDKPLPIRARIFKKRVCSYIPDLEVTLFEIEDADRTCDHTHRVQGLLDYLKVQSK